MAETECAVIPSMKTSSLRLWMVMVIILLAGFSVHAQRWCPKKDKGAEECEEDNLYYEHMCCGDLEKSNECCKAFTIFDYLIASLGFAFIFDITYAVCSIK